MDFSTNVNQTTFGILLDSSVFETLPALRMFKNQFHEDLGDRDIRVRERSHIISPEVAHRGVVVFLRRTQTKRSKFPRNEVAHRRM